MPAVLRRGVMDELATAAAAVAIATDAYAEKDSELGLTFTTYMDVEAQEAAEERINVDKENDISIPAEREVQAGNPKVLNATREPRSTPHAQPLPQVVGHNDVLRNSLSRRLLLQKADGMFPEGQEAPRAMVKDGTPRPPRRPTSSS
jgi:hypothetical protein